MVQFHTQLSIIFVLAAGAIVIIAIPLPSDKYGPVDISGLIKIPANQENTEWVYIFSMFTFEFDTYLYNNTALKNGGMSEYIYSMICHRLY